MARPRTVRGRQRMYERNINRVRQRNSEYASVLSDPKSRFQSTSSATTDKDNIKTYLERPYDNAEVIAATMREAYIKNGVISKVLDYYQSIPTYNYSIYPVLGNKQYQLENNLQQDYIDVAYGLNQYNIPFFASYFFKMTLIEGATFWYTIQDNTGIGYLKFPIEWCRISSLENGVYRYRLDISKIKAEVVDSLPTEIQNAYQDYKSQSGLDDTTKWYNNKWYYLSDNAMAFTFDQNALFNGGIAISPFVSVLADSLSLDKAKDNVEIKDKLDTLRLIHSKIPVNSDGVPTINVKTAKIFDDQMRSRLPNGVIAVTSPSNVTNIPLTGSGNAGAYDTINKGMEQLFYDLGTSSGLFGSATTSSNIVKESVKKDANWVYTNFYPMIENYYNFVMTQIKTKSKIPWNIKFIRESNFTLKDDITNFKDQLAFGGSRMNYLAACGFNPIEIVSQLQFEQQVLDIDSLMVVKPTSNTISSKDSANGGSGSKTIKNPVRGQIGRPKTDNPTDDTDRLDGGA